MSKVTMKVDEEVFYDLVKLKGKMKVKTWDELFKKIVKVHKK